MLLLRAGSPPRRARTMGTMQWKIVNLAESKIPIYRWIGTPIDTCTDGQMDGQVVREEGGYMGTMQWKIVNLAES